MGKVGVAPCSAGRIRLSGRGRGFDSGASAIHDSTKTLVLFGEESHRFEEIGLFQELSQWDKFVPRGTNLSHVGQICPTWDKVGQICPTWDKFVSRGTKWDNVNSPIRQRPGRARQRDMQTAPTMPRAVTNRGRGRGGVEEVWGRVWTKWWVFLIEQ